MLTGTGLDRVGFGMDRVGFGMDWRVLGNELSWIRDGLEGVRERTLMDSGWIG